MIKLIYVQTEDQKLSVTTLSKEYIDFIESLGFDLTKDPTFSRSELSGKLEKYSPPNGFQFLAIYDDTPVGTVSVRKIEEGVCELNRLYVKPSSRGKGIAKLLIEQAIDEAQSIGYHTMRLDSHSLLKDALKLYKSIGFKQVEPYYNNPMAELIYFELELGQS